MTEKRRTEKRTGGETQITDELYLSDRWKMMSLVCLVPCYAHVLLTTLISKIHLNSYDRSIAHRPTFMLKKVTFLRRLDLPRSVGGMGKGENLIF
jgi:hypothetical protein